MEQQRSNSNIDRQVENIIENEKRSIIRDNILYWIAFVCITWIIFFLIIYSGTIFSGMRDGEIRYNHRMGFKLGFIYQLLNYPANGISLGEINKNTLYIVIPAGILYAIFFSSLTLKECYHLDHLKDLALNFPNRDAIDTITNEYLLNNRSYQLYEKLVMDILVLAGPAAIDPLTQFIRNHIHQAVQELDKHSLIMIKKGLDALQQIDGIQEMDVVKEVMDSETAIRSRFLDHGLDDMTVKDNEALIASIFGTL